MAFRSEPPYTHGTLAKTAVILINLGTPEAPTASAVRSYLRQFLSDPRVVEIPRAVWWIILNCFILPIRSSQSARKYASIWTTEGSPLKVHTQRQALLLRGYLGERGNAVRVEYAMRYGSPSVASVLDALHADGCERILVLPAYPQYSATTTASIFDAVFAHYADQRNMPELRTIKHYHDHPSYIDALKRSVLAHWEKNGRPDKLVMSFHGIPKRSLLRGDPYHCECHKTARLLTTELGLAPDQWQLTFQSRFGRQEWLQPYTAPTLVKLAQQGVKRVDILCPGFTSDCLETLEEISMEARHDFLEAGGTAFHYIPCLNEEAAGIAALADICEEHMGGWAIRRDAGMQQRQEQEGRHAAAAAKALGAAA